MVEEKLEWVLISSATYTDMFQGFKVALPSGSFKTKKEVYCHIIKYKTQLESQAVCPYKSIRCVANLVGLGVSCRTVYEFSIGGLVFEEESSIEINSALRRSRGFPKLSASIRAYPHP